MRVRLPGTVPSIAIQRRLLILLVLLGLLALVRQLLSVVTVHPSLSGSLVSDALRKARVVRRLQVLLRLIKALLLALVRALILSVSLPIVITIALPDELLLVVLLRIVLLVIRSGRSIEMLLLVLALDPKSRSKRRRLVEDAVSVLISKTTIAVAVIPRLLHLVCVCQASLHRRLKLLLRRWRLTVGSRHTQRRRRNRLLNASHRLLHLLVRRMGCTSSRRHMSRKPSSLRLLLRRINAGRRAPKSRRTHCSRRRHRRRCSAICMRLYAS